jgi:hypothetical protein
MSTVLSGFTIADRKAFFQSHGTADLYIRDNEAAKTLWIEEHLKVQASCMEDNQVLDLIQTMCHPPQDERPTATEVVSVILDFEGPPYYGFCCDRNETHRSSGQDPDNTATFYDNDTLSTRPASRASDSYSLPKLLPGPDSCYETRSVQEIEDGVTIQSLIPDEKILLSQVASVSSKAPILEESEAGLVQPPAVRFEASDNLNNLQKSSGMGPEVSPQIPHKSCHI